MGNYFLLLGNIQEFFHCTDKVVVLELQAAELALIPFKASTKKDTLFLY